MSSVRMCDNTGCGRIFSENEDGWATGTVAVQRRRENGTRFVEQQQSDRCNACSGAAPPSPTLAPPQLPPAAPTIAEQAQAAEQADDHEMLRQLQRELAELRGGQAPPTVAGTVVDADPVRM